MALLNFRKRDHAGFEPVNRDVVSLLQGYSIEVMPRTAAQIGDFRALLPEGTRVYVAHIDGTPIDDPSCRLRSDQSKLAAFSSTTRCTVGSAATSAPRSTSCWS